jgi:molybdopterin molybdotransferase
MIASGMGMKIHIQINTDPIPGRVEPPARPDLGTWVEFRGVVRGEEDGRTITALEYEAYQSMAEREMLRILEALAGHQPCLTAHVIHRIGIIPVGESAIYVGIGARHRAEAFTLLEGFMDRLKQDVPIWKRRVIEALSATAGAPWSAPPAGDRASESGDGPHSADEVLALVRSACPPLEAERVALSGAAGRVLREPVRASEDQPLFDRSSVDGYAVRLDDPGPEFRVVDEIRAGDWKPRGLQPGEAVRIATGGALPGDGLQVLMKEDTRVEGGTLTVLCRDHERNIRFRGEDARAGQELVGAGTILQPGTVGLLASVGCAAPLVTRRPRVLHLATGDELVSPDQTPGPGQIRDSNSTLVRAFLGQWEIEPEQLRVGEARDTLRSVFRTPHSAFDLLLISGGASVGEHDFTRGLLEELGFTVHVRKTTARPGKPLILAQRGAALAFGLPGNPLAHFVCLNLYVRAALEAWAGQTHRTRFHTGVIGADLIAGGHARETFWPARWEWTDGAATLTPLRWSSSGDLTALATANALIRVTTGARHLARGSSVEFVCTETSS